MALRLTVWKSPRAKLNIYRHSTYMNTVTSVPVYYAFGEKFPGISVKFGPLFSSLSQIAEKNSLRSGKIVSCHGTMKHSDQHSFLFKNS